MFSIVNFILIELRRILNMVPDVLKTFGLILEIHS